MKKLAIRLTLTAVLLILAACGFQPRGSVPQLNNLPGPVYISGIEKYSPLHRELSTQLQQAGISLTDDGNSAASLLRIRDVRHNSRLFSLDSSTRGVEYELEESLKFAVRHANQGELVEEQTVRVVRILYRPNDQVLARDREEAQLRNDMRRDLVGRIIRRIKAQG
jgi:LPS-assembly lipoprotein